MTDIEKAISDLRSPCGVPPTRQREIADLLERIDQGLNRVFEWAGIEKTSPKESTGEINETR